MTKVTAGAAIVTVATGVDPPPSAKIEKLMSRKFSDYRALSLDLLVNVVVDAGLAAPLVVIVIVSFPLLPGCVTVVVPAAGPLLVIVIVDPDALDPEAIECDE